MTTIIHTKAGFVMLTEPWPEKPKYPAAMMSAALIAWYDSLLKQYDDQVKACLASAIPFQDQDAIQQIVWDTYPNSADRVPRDNEPYQIECEVEIEDERLNSEPEVWGQVVVLVQTESGERVQSESQEELWKEVLDLGYHSTVTDYLPTLMTKFHISRK